MNIRTFTLNRRQFWYNTRHWASLLAHLLLAAHQGTSRNSLSQNT